MLDVRQDIVNSLKTILPTYYELFCDENTQMPCITYIEDNNSIAASGDTLGYSNISFIIKVWGYTVSDIAGYSLQVDTSMRQLGYKRTSTNEIIVGNQIEKVLYYSALGKENY